MHRRLAARCAGSVLALLASLNSVEQLTRAQSARPNFEAATIKVVRPEDLPLALANSSSTVVPQGGGRFAGNNVTVALLIVLAFRTSENGLIDSQVVGGPAWMRSTRFNVAATTEGAMSRDALIAQLPALLRSLLEDRFKLQTHLERRPTNIYALTKARSDGRLGPQLRPSTVDCEAIERERAATRTSAAALAALATERPVCGARFTPGGLVAGGVGVGQIVSVANGAVDRPVVDRTGLTGRFDIDLQWTRDATVVDGPPSIFTALQEQLGLKLEAREEPHDVLVIDHIELPTPD